MSVTPMPTPIPHNPFGLCTWDENADCDACDLRGKLHCRWDAAVLARFLVPASAFSVAAAFGVGLASYVTGAWGMLAAYLAFFVLFFLVIEIRLLCSHCPYYSRDGFFFTVPRQPRRAQVLAVPAATDEHARAGGAGRRLRLLRRLPARGAGVRGVAHRLEPRRRGPRDGAGRGCRRRGDARRPRRVRRRPHELFLPPLHQLLMPPKSRPASVARGIPGRNPVLQGGSD